MENERDYLLFTGSGHPKLAAEVAKALGIQLGKVEIRRFPDGEVSLQLLDNVRGRDVFVLQTIALDPDHYLVELLIMMDALKRASARTVNVVVPYYGYCRQDRKDRPRVPITAKLVANLLERAGAARLLTVDLHAEQVQGFFDVPVDNLQSRHILAAALQREGFSNGVVVAPDAGSVKLARDFANLLGAEVAVLDKQRINAEQVKVVTAIGEITGKDVLLADDICSTAGTLASAAKACQEKGAKRIFAAITHGLFVGEAVGRIEQSPIERLYVTDTIPVTERLQGATKIVYVPIASLLANAIARILSCKSISSLNELNVPCIAE